MQRPRYTKLCRPVLGSGVVWTEVPFARKPWGRESDRGLSSLTFIRICNAGAVENILFYFVLFLKRK